MFGVPGMDDVPISTAVRASGALPMVYSPVEINGRELIDGGIVSTTNLDLAIQTLTVNGASSFTLTGASTFTTQTSPALS